MQPRAWGLSQELDRVRSGFGLGPDPVLEALERYLQLSFVPPSFQDPEAPLPPTARVLRHTTFDRALEHHLRDWIDVLPDQPTVYATLGTAHNHLTDIFRAIIAGLQERPINLILTVGRNGDPAAFGPVPPNVHIERYIPQSLLLPHCDVVVFHAGWSTTLGALTHGPPQVLAPITADQPENAQRCAALGVGLIVHPNERTPEAIGKAVQAVLDEPSFGE